MADIRLDADHEVIYLLDDDSQTSWCNDPAPAPEMKPADAVKYIRADVVEKELAEAKRGCEALRLALIELVELKDHKESEGKTDHYLVNQPKAWAKAREVLQPLPPAPEGDER